jgi:hypothetical protein
MLCLLSAQCAWDMLDMVSSRDTAAIVRAIAVVMKPLLRV